MIDIDQLPVILYGSYIARAKFRYFSIIRETLQKWSLVNANEVKKKYDENMRAEANCLVSTPWKAGNVSSISIFLPVISYHENPYFFFK